MILIFGLINQYGVLSHFSEGIKSDLEALGENCLILPVDDGIKAAQLLSMISPQQVKFSICLNGSGLDRALQYGKTFAYAVDHPLLLLPHLQKYKGYELLCVAKEHTAFANMLGIPARDFPHAVAIADLVETNGVSQHKTDDIIFPISYFNKTAAQQKLTQMGVWNQLKPALDVVGSINEFLMAVGVLPNGNQPARAQLNEAMFKITCEADNYIRAVNREKTLARYTELGVELQVYGRNVSHYQTDYPTHQYHEQISYTELLKKIENAKYVVHNSPGFQFALHERIVFPLAKGTPVLFDADINQKQMLAKLPAIYPSDFAKQQANVADIEASRNEVSSSHTWASQLKALF